MVMAATAPCASVVCEPDLRVRSRATTDAAPRGKRRRA